ncbi:hypothetical protein [Cryobacterium suzukii]|uniref:hypothetical protein n=1 Tax=Cryobacterium suzukii TaxID=1259198 RepID=UPI003B969FE3
MKPASVPVAATVLDTMSRPNGLPTMRTAIPATRLCTAKSRTVIRPAVADTRLMIDTTRPPTTATRTANAAAPTPAEIPAVNAANARLMPTVAAISTANWPSIFHTSAWALSTSPAYSVHDSDTERASVANARISVANPDTIVVIPATSTDSADANG